MDLSYDRFLDLFDDLWLLSKESVESGLLDQKLLSKKLDRLRRPVDKEILEDMKRWREILAKNIYKNNPISAISALAVSPKQRQLALYLNLRTRNLTGLFVRAFLKHLLRHLRGPVVLLWDRGTIHRLKRGQAVDQKPSKTPGGGVPSPTRPSSILQNTSGTRPTAPWPTVRQRTCSSLTECSETRSDESKDRRSSSGPVSTLPICHGSDREWFLYLCESQ